MSFWSNANFELKRAYRWQVTFGTGTGGPSNYKPYFAKKVSKPSFAVGETTHNYLNHKFYYPGQVTWNDVTMTLVDPVGPNADQSKALMEILGKMGYVYPHKSAQNGVQTISKNRSVNSIGQLTITQLKGDQGSKGLTDPGTGGKIAGKWVLHNPWVKEVKFGDLDYSSEDMVMIDVTFKYDWAMHSLT